MLVVAHPPDQRDQQQRDYGAATPMRALCADLFLDERE